MANEAIQAIKDLIYPHLWKFYIAIAVTVIIALIISVIVIWIKKKIKH